jgi:hypothetical protein
VEEMSICFPYCNTVPISFGPVANRDPPFDIQKEEGLCDLSFIELFSSGPTQKLYNMRFEPEISKTVMNRVYFAINEVTNSTVALKLSKIILNSD